jgi:uncharacterized protein YpbB
MNSRNTVAQEQDFLRVVALNVMIPLANERTLQAAYYILRGRKANQTVQDVHLYNLYPYYRMFPRFSKEDWDKIVSTLLQDGFVRQEAGDGEKRKPTFAVTEKGRAYAKERADHYRFDFWLGPFTQSDLTEWLELFWQRLHLLVQTVSQMLANDLAFFPVVSDKRTQQWVKAQITDANSRERWMNQLGDELFFLLQSLPADVQELIAAQFSGASQVGKTLGQLAMRKNVAPMYLSLLFRYGLACSIQRLIQEKDQFPLLSRLVVRSEKLDPRLSESAAKTYSLIERGIDKDEIAKIRRVKVSTVEDHLVEMALRCPEWDCSRYLDENLGALIVQTSEQLKTSRLRLIKDSLGTSVSYLQIRLALARRQGEN